MRGPLAMKGYGRESAKTAEAIDADGWLHTGDILDVDSDGYLRVVDRKKELIINAAGKNMSSANIENTIMAACPMVGAMLTIGDACPYNTALLVFDADSVGPYAAQHGLADASPDSRYAEGATEFTGGVVHGRADSGLVGAQRTDDRLGGRCGREPEAAAARRRHTVTDAKPDPPHETSGLGLTAVSGLASVPVGKYCCRQSASPHVVPDA